MKLAKQERQILIEIFKSINGLFLFSLHSKLELSPKELFSAIEILKQNGLLEVVDDRVTITNEGVNYAAKVPLKSKSDIHNVKLIKEEFLGKKININEFYIPQNFEK
jgi:predicted methyltransferase